MKTTHSFHRGSHSGPDKHTNKTNDEHHTPSLTTQFFCSLMERWRGGGEVMEAALPGSGALCWGGGGGRSQGERGVSVSRAERRRRLAISKAKGFQEPKINVNLRPPGRVNRAIMELYTPTHTHTHLQTAGTHNKHTYTYTYCPGIIYTEGECFIFCSHCCRQSEREG